jgi:hypothetical protein
VDVFDCDGGGWIAVCFCGEQLLLVNEMETDHIDDVVKTWPHGLLVVFGSNTGMFQQVLCIRAAIVHCASRAYFPLPAFAVVSGILLCSRVSTSSIIRTSSHLVRHTQRATVNRFSIAILQTALQTNLQIIVQYLPNSRDFHPFQANFHDSLFDIDTPCHDVN